MPRVHAELADQGVRVGRKRVARLMRSAGLEGVSRRRKHRTTRHSGADSAAPDLLERDFGATGPDQKWVADIERHEALSNLAVMKRHRRVLVAAGASKLRAA